MKSTIHQFRYDAGYIYERESLGMYQRVDPESVDGIPVGILSTEIMLHVGRGLYVRTHRCVLHVGCSYCGAKKGKRCIGVHGPTSGTHCDRRDTWRSR